MKRNETKDHFYSQFIRPTKCTQLFHVYYIYNYVSYMSNVCNIRE
jgi:hypothetical protein